jgi:hypothetical protein
MNKEEKVVKVGGMVPKVSTRDEYKRKLAKKIY